MKKSDIAIVYRVVKEVTKDLQRQLSMITALAEIEMHKKGITDAHYDFAKRIEELARMGLERNE